MHVKDRLRGVDGLMITSSKVRQDYSK